jgi:molybdopterin synthase sulfur carrier subunit
VRVLLFGRLAETAGWRQKEVTASASLSDLKAHLREAWPELGAALNGRGVQAAVDKVVVAGDLSLTPDSEVAFLPPMSGG